MQTQGINYKALSTLLTCCEVQDDMWKEIDQVRTGGKLLLDVAKVTLVFTEQLSKKDSSTIRAIAKKWLPFVNQVCIRCDSKGLC